MLRPAPFGVAVLGLSVLAAAPASAQTPSERARLDSLRAAIAAESDTTALIAREQARIAVARVERDDPFLHMELGWTAYRLGELTGATRRFEDAAGEFQWAADLRPGWPYAWYALGVSELGLGESRLILVENLRQMLGQDALSLAATSFVRALEADPGFAAALVDLAATALRQRVSPRLVVAQNALRLAANRPAARQPPVLLMRAVIERRLGAPDSALAAARAYLAAGGDSGLAALEMARAQASARRPDSAVAVYGAALLRPLSDTARLAFREDVEWIGTPEELAGYDAAPRDSLGRLIARFWERREVADGRRRGARLLEQFRRLAVAEERYSLVSARRDHAVGYAFVDSTQDRFDDRGVIYLRHGEPHDRASYNGPNVEPNESWRYDRPGEEPLVFHFVARNDVRDYRLVASLADVLGQGVDHNIADTPDVPGRARCTTYTCDLDQDAGRDPLTDLYASRANFSPLYNRIATGRGRSDLLARERVEGREMAREGTTTDSWVLRFDNAVRPIVTTFLVQGPGRGGELHVVFAVPAQRLEVRTMGSQYVYPLRFHLTVSDSVTLRRIAEVDTVRAFTTATPLAAGSWITEQLVVPVPPGRWAYNFVVEELGRSSGAHLGGRNLDVPHYGETFEASDVVMGREGSGLAWRRPEGTVPLNPLQRYARGGQATLWYELYGLPMGANVLTQVRIARQGGRSFLRRLLGRGSGADLEYTTVTDAPGRARVRQSLDLGGLEPGRYDLVVIFIDRASGRRLERRQPFEILAAAP